MKKNEGKTVFGSILSKAQGLLGATLFARISQVVDC
jgi:hypothetical protein